MDVAPNGVAGAGVGCEMSVPDGCKSGIGQCSGTQFDTDDEVLLRGALHEFARLVDAVENERESTVRTRSTYLKLMPRFYLL